MSEEISTFEKSLAAHHARSAGLTHQTFSKRNGQRIEIAGRSVVNFANCSYLGLDLDPDLIAAAKHSLDQWGLHFCCARTRLSTSELDLLESDLARLFGAPVLTFPSVTSAHHSVLPLIANGDLLSAKETTPDKKISVRMVFDRFAHASMQSLKPILAKFAELRKIEHNYMDALRREIDMADQQGQHCVYICDGVYSMGGLAPLAELRTLMETRSLYLYIDDAHGTSIYGENGKGYVADFFGGDHWPNRLFCNFSLAKGFGCNGGGIILPSEKHKTKVRFQGQTYLFSGPLDFAMVGAARKSVEYHFNGRVKELQDVLRQKIRVFDENLRTVTHNSISPIRMVMIGDAEIAIKIGEFLLKRGFYASVVFHPVVPKNEAQLRICITAIHHANDIIELCHSIRSALDAYAITYNHDQFDPALYSPSIATQPAAEGPQ